MTRKKEDEIVEDTILETSNTKITARCIGEKVVMCEYVRYDRSEWDFGDDWVMTLQHFESMKDNVVYLALKYKAKIEQEAK